MTWGFAFGLAARQRKDGELLVLFSFALSQPFSSTRSAAGTAIWQNPF